MARTIKPKVGTISRRKNRKAHFSAPSHVRRLIMSATLSKELRAKYNVKSIPVRRDDEVLVKSGHFKGREGKVVEVYRKKWAVYVDKVQREKANGTTVNVPLNANKLIVTKLKIDNSRKRILDRLASKKKADKGKVSQQDVSMAQVD
eukprot:Phypoly_transcript_12020.p2 GENE.Phypoly_transcript_12020~~Phypoly_transcript_12020.p2  ORF type:complete len:147 (-),score=21.30 Phypoly_transcript_12020:55-495(-)